MFICMRYSESICDGYVCLNRVTTLRYFDKLVRRMMNFHRHV